jgi:ribonucleoside-diphosphate reductase alpha chain
MNSYSFVENPFTSNAYINWNKLEGMTRLATRMLDDIVDIELEKISKIIDKIKSDPEDDSIKRTEIELWEKIYKTGKEGRRLGLGTTARSIDSI